MSHLTRSQWTADHSGVPMGCERHYQHVAFRLLDGTALQLDEVYVDGRDNEVHVYVSTGKGFMTDVAATRALEETWPHDVFPIGITVQFVASRVEVHA